ncbi:peptidoglycan-binding domain-containing protein [Granulicella cerasi]|uniref:Peptidoglycan-binding domain-containing protein n=1 Tax=Granulicella cerasi TaxID=741063 RepID=A0ABW1Z760_9BACT|nr:peptidoglycan-binding domain-containing protein [Granulicella cerasi]
MRSATAFALLFSIALPAAAARPHHAKHAATTSHSSAHKKTAAAVSHTPAMAPERATAIQAALIKQGYLTGEPSGNWDSSSVSAMQKMQSDNGWQTKYTPDSRALIKLGLAHNDTTAVASAPSSPAGGGVSDASSQQ